MADKQQQAAKRVIKKLSALRATMTKTEREILDQIVTSAKLDFAVTDAEVTGHLLTDRKQTDAKRDKITDRLDTGAKRDKLDAGMLGEGAEVTGHMLGLGKQTDAKRDKITDRLDAGAVNVGRMEVGIKVEAKQYKIDF